MKERNIFALCNTFGFIAAALFFGAIEQYFFSGIMLSIATIIMIWGIAGNE